jgi:hypothetical protein
MLKITWNIALGAELVVFREEAKKNIFGTAYLFLPKMFASLVRSPPTRSSDHFHLSQ